MTRIPYLRREELGPEGQELWDGIVGSVGGEVATAEGGLAGPFNAFVTVPGAGRRLSALGAKLRFGTSIERRLSEIAIITTGARWQAEFEWWAHAAMAREHGVAGPVVDAIGRGEDPPFEADDERAVYAVARQLAGSGRLDQEAYDAAHRFLGDAGMVELVSLCGYYTLISFLLNAFAVPLPPGAAPMWDAPLGRLPGPPPVRVAGLCSCLPASSHQAGVMSRPGVTMAAGRQARMPASSADRDRAVRILQASFVEGRLAMDEFEQRVGLAIVSRDFRELLALTADLPAGPFDRLPAHRVTPRRPSRKRSRRWLARLAQGSS